MAKYCVKCGSPATDGGGYCAACVDIVALVLAAQDISSLAHPSVKVPGRIRTAEEVLSELRYRARKRLDEMKEQEKGGSQ